MTNSSFVSLLFDTSWMLEIAHVSVDGIIYRATSFLMNMCWWSAFQWDHLPYMFLFPVTQYPSAMIPVQTDIAGLERLPCIFELLFFPHIVTSLDNTTLFTLIVSIPRECVEISDFHTWCAFFLVGLGRHKQLPWWRTQLSTNFLRVNTKMRIVAHLGVQHLLILFLLI